MEQELLCDNAFFKHPARCHVCHPWLKSSFNFTFDIIYTIDLMALCSSPLLPWKASKSWRSLLYIFSPSHVPMTVIFPGLMTIPLSQTTAWFFFCCRAVEKIDYSAHNFPLFSLILVFVRSAAFLYSCVSAPPVLLTPWSKPGVRLGSSMFYCLDPLPPCWAEESAPSDSPRVLCRNHIPQGIRSSCMLLKASLKYQNAFFWRFLPLINSL